MSTRPKEETPKWNSGHVKVDYQRRDLAELYGTKLDSKSKGSGVVKSEKDAWDEKLDKWNKRNAYKALAENVLESRIITEEGAKDIKTLNEAETTLHAMKTYLDKTFDKEEDLTEENFRNALMKTNMYREMFINENNKNGANVSNGNTEAGQRLDAILTAVAKKNMPPPSPTKKEEKKGALLPKVPTVSAEDMKRVKEDAKARVVANTLQTFIAQDAAEEEKASILEKEKKQQENNKFLKEREKDRESRPSLYPHTKADPDDIGSYLTRDKPGPVSKHSTTDAGAGARNMKSGNTNKSNGSGAPATVFNPDNLSSVSRHKAFQKKQQRLIAEIEKENKEKSRFKARPMPGSTLCSVSNPNNSTRNAQAGTTGAHATGLNHQTLSRFTTRQQENREGPSTTMRDSLDLNLGVDGIGSNGDQKKGKIVSTTNPNPNPTIGKNRQRLRDLLNALSDSDGSNDSDSDDSEDDGRPIQEQLDALDAAIQDITTSKKHPEDSIDHQADSNNGSSHTSVGPTSNNHSHTSSSSDGPYSHDSVEGAYSGGTGDARSVMSGLTDDNVYLAQLQASGVDIVDGEGMGLSSVKTTDNDVRNGINKVARDTLLGRQEEWQRKRQQKQSLLQQELSIKEEAEHEIMERSKRASSAHESWARAKREHAAQSNKYWKDEETRIKKKQQDLEKKILLLEHKKSERKESDQRLKALQQQDACTSSNSSHGNKMKKTRRKSVFRDTDNDLYEVEEPCIDETSSASHPSIDIQTRPHTVNSTYSNGSNSANNFISSSKPLKNNTMNTGTGNGKGTRRPATSVVVGNKYGTAANTFDDPHYFKDGGFVKGVDKDSLDLLFGGDDSLIIDNPTDKDVYVDADGNTKAKGGKKTKKKKKKKKAASSAYARDNSGYCDDQEEADGDNDGPTLTRTTSLRSWSGNTNAVSNSNSNVKEERRVHSAVNRVPRIDKNAVNDSVGTETDLWLDRQLRRQQAREANAYSNRKLSGYIAPPEDGRQGIVQSGGNKLAAGVYGNPIKQNTNGKLLSTKMKNHSRDRDIKKSKADETLEKMKQENEYLSQQLQLMHVRQIEAEEREKEEVLTARSHYSQVSKGSTSSDKSHSSKTAQEDMYVSDTEHSEVLTNDDDKSKYLVDTSTSQPTPYGIPKTTSSGVDDTSVRTSIDVDDLERILAGNTTHAPTPAAPQIPQEWPDTLEEEGLVPPLQSPQKTGDKNPFGALSPRDKLRVLKREASKSPVKNYSRGHIGDDGIKNVHDFPIPEHIKEKASDKMNQIRNDLRKRYPRAYAKENDDPASLLSSTLPSSNNTDGNDTANRNLDSISNGDGTRKGTTAALYDINNQFDHFFDPSSTSDKGRYRLHDARDYITDTMHRKKDMLHEGVTLLVGIRRGSEGLNRKEEVITLLFDRSEFSEKSARAWWLENRDRLC